MTSDWTKPSWMAPEAMSSMLAWEPLEVIAVTAVSVFSVT